jgi:ligand-binding SRPBCC domain-containing protein
MTLFEHTEQIHRPVEEVFAFLADPTNLPRWQMSLIAVRPHRSGPLRPGVEVTETRRFLGRTMETTWVCTEHRPSRRSVIESDEGPVPFRGIWDLEADGGATRFTWTVGDRWPRRPPCERGRRPVARQELAEDALRLKRLLEQNRHDREAAAPHDVDRPGAGLGFVVAHQIAYGSADAAQWDLQRRLRGLRRGRRLIADAIPATPSAGCSASSASSSPPATSSPTTPITATPARPRWPSSTTRPARQPRGPHAGGDAVPDRPFPERRLAPRGPVRHRRERRPRGGAGARAGS